MQIHSISKALSLPLILIAGAILYLSSKDQLDSVYIFLPVFLGVGLYVFHGVIDHWWLERFPLKFDPKLREWLTMYFPPYQKYDENDTKKFEYRLGLYLEGRLFKSVGAEQRDVPEDIKCMVAAHGIHLCLGLDDYLIGDMDRIYLYKHPFPTPDKPFLHNVEVNIEDGVMILSLEQLANAILHPTKFYNNAYHAYAESFNGIHSKMSFPRITEDDWSKIELICGWNQTEIEQQLMLPSLDKNVVLIVLWCSFPTEFQRELPGHYEQYCKIFNQKPRTLQNHY